MTAPVYPKEDITQGIFSFDSMGFCVNDFRRETAKSLRRVLFPEFTVSEKALNSACVEAARTISKDWRIAQLQHYAIEVNPEIDGYKAKALLVTSVAHGLCDTVPPQVSRINATLQERYEAQMNDYHAKMEAHQIQGLPQRISKFEACNTPAAEATCDASLFLRKYFLDEHGQPDKARTPHPMMLHGYREKGMALSGRIDRVPALHLADTGPGGTSNITIIGWDRERIDTEAQEIDLDHNVMRASSSWNTQMRRHEEHKAKFRKSRESSDSFDPYHTCGIYAISCGAVEAVWPVLAKGLRLRMLSEGRLAVFDLGIVCGLMVFAESQAKVSKLVASGHSQSLTDPSSYQAHDDDDDMTSDSDDVDDNSHPRRLYLQWRGYDTRTGELQHDPYNHNTGYIDFEDALSMSFSGTLYLKRELGSETQFKGFRIPGMAGPLTMNWDALSHLESNRAKVPEHIW